MVHRIFAYIDPGTGSFFLQLLLGGVFAATLTTKQLWRRIKFALGRWRITWTSLGIPIVCAGIALMVLSNRSLNRTASSPQVAEGPIVLIGGSIAAGYPPDSFPGLYWVNKGICRNRVEQVQARLVRDAIDLRPKEIVLMVGLNNILMDNQSPEQVYGGIVTTAKRITDAGIPLAICHLLPVPEDWNPRGQITREEINGRVEKINGLLDRYIADCRHGSMRIIAWPKLGQECYSITIDDGLPDVHLNPKGYQVLTVAVRNTLAP